MKLQEFFQGKYQFNAFSEEGFWATFTFDTYKEAAAEVRKLLKVYEKKVKEHMQRYRSRNAVNAKRAREGLSPTWRPMEKPTMETYFMNDALIIYCVMSMKYDDKDQPALAARKKYAKRSKS
jgi:hypothetical protein